jgi:hypothetical protein
MSENDLPLMILDCICFAGSLALMFVPLSKKRIRDCWAKAVFFLVGLIGAISYGLKFILDMHWLVLGSHNSYEFHLWFNSTRGLLIGWLTALFFSGQVYGRKLPENEHLKSKV